LRFGETQSFLEGGSEFGKTGLCAGGTLVDVFRVTAQTLDCPPVLGALVFEAFETSGEVANEAFDVIGVLTAYRTT